jgi:hypothetical protein
MKNVLAISLISLIAIGCCACSAPYSGIPAEPIPNDDFYSLVTGDMMYIRNTDYAEGYSNQLAHLTIPQNPFMASNGRSNMHNDAYMTDAYEVAGPLGVDAEVISTYRGLAQCATVTFDSKGRIWTVCMNLSLPQLLLLDPYTLNELAAYPLPLRWEYWQDDPIGPYQDTSGGAYFCLDDQDRAIIGTNNHSIQIVAYDEGKRAFQLMREYDLEDYVIPKALPARDKVGAVLPDWNGLLWFVTRYGVVGTVDMESGDIHSIELAGEEIQNSFTIGEDGVYIISDYALYRFHADDDGLPVIDWSSEYDRGSQVKLGQINQGSGTTPTLIGEMVVIADNAEPRMNIIFLKRSDGSEVCRIPVFPDNESCTENSLIGLAREGADGIEYSVIVENNYGWENIFSGADGRSTVGGVVRVDALPDGDGGYSCVEVWNSPERSLTCVPKLSLGSGLIYLYTKEPSEENRLDAWYFTAVDFATGETVFKVLTGTGLGYNNNYAPIILGPQGGTAYIGTLNGLVSVRDTGQ